MPSALLTTLNSEEVKIGLGKFFNLDYGKTNQVVYARFFLNNTSFLLNFRNITSYLYFSKIIPSQPTVGRLDSVGLLLADWTPVSPLYADWIQSACCWPIGPSRPTADRLAPSLLPLGRQVHAPIYLWNEYLKNVEEVFKKMLIMHIKILIKHLK